MPVKGVWWRFVGLALLALGLARLTRRPQPDGGPCRQGIGTKLSFSWIPVPGGSLRVSKLSRASGSPVLFLHSIGGRVEHWNKVFSALADDRAHITQLDAIALELPGHGESDPLTDDATVAAIVAQIDAALNFQGWRRATLVAHGSSAAFAFAYAGSRPDRVSSIMLIDPAGDQHLLTEEESTCLAGAVAAAPHAELEWHFRQLLVGAPAEVASIVETDLRSSDANTLVELVLSTLELDLRSLSTAFEGPKLAWISDFNDTKISLHRLDRTVQSRPSRLGHWPMLEDPAAVARAISSFVDQTVRRSTPSHA